MERSNVRVFFVPYRPLGLLRYIGLYIIAEAAKAAPANS
jgi:hypothetical protein